MTALLLFCSCCFFFFFFSQWCCCCRLALRAHPQGNEAHAKGQPQYREYIQRAHTSRHILTGIHTGSWSPGACSEREQQDAKIREGGKKGEASLADTGRGSTHGEAILTGARNEKQHWKSCEQKQRHPADSLTLTVSGPSLRSSLITCLDPVSPVCDLTACAVLYACSGVRNYTHILTLKQPTGL
ncbi:hypothetical protein VTK26DRAFT_4449 [Humicola hyalothermophila]